ncbi:hypothetical protein B9Z55_012110 [Caenorhabditis nigoni]|uniref:SCP domain-containing protein n=1 Tax=Caenorhabditis nigoni TaxID=1611254 RepID=A0A2G5TVV5_9PELO|nr:hypothetical protein B9Z55_012110 [Caenorhabditis nigoni]
MNRIFAGIFLLFLAQGRHSAPLREKRGRVIMGRELLASHINAERIQLANMRQIANMYEMNYSNELEQIALKLTCENARTPGPNYMVVVLYDEMTQARVKAGTPAEQQNAAMESGTIAFGLPGQYKVGCADFDTPCTIQGSASTIVSACLIGPENSMRLDGMKFGPPGSQCPIGRAANGLCLAPY